MNAADVVVASSSSPASAARKPSPTPTGSRSRGMRVLRAKKKDGAHVAPSFRELDQSIRIRTSVLGGGAAGAFGLLVRAAGAFRRLGGVSGSGRGGGIGRGGGG